MQKIDREVKNNRSSKITIETNTGVTINKGDSAMTKEILEGCFVIISKYKDRVVVTHAPPAETDLHVSKHEELKPQGERPQEVLFYSVQINSKSAWASREDVYQELRLKTEIAVTNAIDYGEVEHRKYTKGSKVLIEWQTKRSPEIYLVPPM